MEPVPEPSQLWRKLPEEPEEFFRLQDQALGADLESDPTLESHGCVCRFRCWGWLSTEDVSQAVAPHVQHEEG